MTEWVKMTANKERKQKTPSSSSLPQTALLALAQKKKSKNFERTYSTNVHPS